MPTLREINAFIFEIAPAHLAFEWDKVGLLVGDPNAQVLRGSVSLDPSFAAIDAAGEGGVLVSHHALIFNPVATVTEGATAEKLRRLIRAGCGHIAAHTNWDAAEGGINDALAAALGLSAVRPFGAPPRSPLPSYKIVVMTPPEARERLLDGLSAVGAGVIGNYERCAWYTAGEGTFLPLDGANPAIGAVGQHETTPETRLEMLCPHHALGAAIEAIRKHHPYEEPAFDIYPLHPTDKGLPLGRVGQLSEPLSATSLAAHVSGSLSTATRTWGDKKQIKKVGVAGGAGSDEWKAARKAGADALVTGEVKQHVALEASEAGFVLIEAGHYATEQPGCRALYARLSERFSEVEWVMVEPEAGASGRPS
ncbi:MAG: Nif3-like dinuclear metal center hexameric protein [Armatimonadetes bacterium]|nr:Nif3-like dinuclear metal center hexameric protein [Armatimonadota bacterium]